MRPVPAKRYRDAYNLGYRRGLRLKAAPSPYVTGSWMDLAYQRGMATGTARATERDVLRRATGGELFAWWDKSAQDMTFAGPCSQDQHLLHVALNHAPIVDGRSLAQELEARGYDLTTLRFSVQRRWPSGGTPVPATTKPEAGR